MYLQRRIRSHNVTCREVFIGVIVFTKEEFEQKLYLLVIDKRTPLVEPNHERSGESDEDWDAYDSDLQGRWFDYSSAKRNILEPNKTMTTQEYDRAITWLCSYLEV